MKLKNWQFIQFIIIASLSILYAIWNIVLEAYGINLHSEIFGPVLLGIFATSGILMILVMFYKELKNESN